MNLRTRLLTFLRVPHAPSAPAGDLDVRAFRAAPNYLKYKLVLWALKTGGALIGVLGGLAFLRFVPGWIPGLHAGMPLGSIFALVEIVAVAGLIIQTSWALLLLRLDFEQRWYLVSDRSLRIREGIVRMHEKTITFANIQQVTIEQGPLQRLLGIADLQVRTAGGGSGERSEAGKRKDDLHVGYLRGVGDAAGIRETIRERLRSYADAGLGDPDDLVAHKTVPPVRAEPGSTAELVNAARALAEEARALRRLAPAAARLTR